MMGSGAIGSVDSTAPNGSGCPIGSYRFFSSRRLNTRISLGGLDVALRFRRFDATPVCLDGIFGPAGAGKGAAVGLPRGGIAGIMGKRLCEVGNAFLAATRLETRAAEAEAQQRVVGAAGEHGLEAFDVHGADSRSGGRESVGGTSEPPGRSGAIRTGRQGRGRRVPDAGFLT